MSIGYSLRYYYSIRNPLIRKFSDLGALAEESAIPFAVLEPDFVTREVINQFLSNGYISTSKNGSLYLDVHKVRPQTLRRGLILFLVGEVFLIAILSLFLFAPTVTEVPSFVVLSVFLIGTLLLGLFSYLEAWPFFYLRHSTK